MTEGTCACGHALGHHGRKGYGACRHRGWSEKGLADAERINADCEREGKQPFVVLRVLEALFALAGMHAACTCKRFKRQLTTPTPKGL